MEEKCGKGEIMIRKKRDLSPDAKLRFPDYLGYFFGVNGMGDNKLDQRFYPEVYQAVAGENYTVYAYMNDGSVREFDVKPLIKQGGIFKKIEDETVFKNTLTVLNGTVAWDIAGKRNEYECIDIDPMTIFECPIVPDIPEM